jgi:hypothetical protein
VSCVYWAGLDHSLSMCTSYVAGMLSDPTFVD